MQRCRPLISQALVNIAYRARLQEQVDLKTSGPAGQRTAFSQFCRHGLRLVLGDRSPAQAQLCLCPWLSGEGSWPARRGEASMILPTTSSDPAWSHYRHPIAHHLPVGECGPR